MREEFTLTEQMVGALGVTPIETYVGRDLMFVLESEKAVQTATPDTLEPKMVYSYTIYSGLGATYHLPLFYQQYDGLPKQPQSLILRFLRE